MSEDRDMESVDIPEDPVELAEDGSPLGTLKVGNTIYERKDRAAELGRTADIELVRSASVDITGEDDADRDLLAMYEEYGNEEKRKLAIVRYVKDGLTAAEVALELNVPERTVLMWAYHGKWNKAASREIAVRAEEEARSLANLRLAHREKLLKKQVEDAAEIQGKLMEKVRSDGVSLKSASESLAALAKVQNTAMGVSDMSGAIDRADDGEKKGGPQEKVPLVVVLKDSPSGIPTLRKKGEVIDV